MAVKYFQTFRPSSEYEAAAADAQRRQALADALQQQAYQPLQMDTAGPVSYTQGLAKILQSYMAGKENRKAREAEQKASAAIEKDVAGVERTGQQLRESLESGRKPLTAAETTPDASGLAMVRGPLDPVRLASTKYGREALVTDPELLEAYKAARTKPKMPALTAEQLMKLDPASRKMAQTAIEGGQNLDYGALKFDDKPTTPTELSRTIEERDQLKQINPNDPRIKIYDNKILAMTTAPGTVVNFGSPMLAKNPATGQNELYQPNPRGGMGRFLGVEAAPPTPTLKPLPASVAEDFAQNAKHKAQIQLGLDLLEGKTVNVAGEPVKGDPNAVGIKGALPQSILNRKDPSGVATRAAIANISSMTIKNRSGANVTVGEEPRLMPFIPGPTDDNPTIQKKLRGLLNEINNEDSARSQVYGEDQGYKPFSLPNTTNGLTKEEENELAALRAKRKGRN